MIRSLLSFIFFASLTNAYISDLSVMNRLEMGLIFLEKQDKLGVNATFNIVIGDAELIYLTETAESITDKQSNKIQDIRDKMKKLIDNTKNDEPDDYVVSNILFPEDWAKNKDHKFKPDQVSGPESTKSVKEIYGRSILKDEACNDQLYANDRSDEERSCGIDKDCMDKMTNRNDKSPIAPMQRVIFLSDLRYFKCTENPENAFDIIKDLCNLIYKQVLKLASAGYIESKAYYYMDKVLLCGTYGFQEFYDANILKPLMKKQNDNGSMGKSKNKEEKNVLTAQWVAIMSSMYRFKLTESD